MMPYADYFQLFFAMMADAFATLAARLLISSYITPLHFADAARHYFFSSVTIAFAFAATLLMPPLLLFATPPTLRCCTLIRRRCCFQLPFLRLRRHYFH